MKTMISILSIAVLLLLSGCISFFAPKTGSREYTPHSDQERIEFEKADRNVYPDDIRLDFSKFEDTAVAWAGIIQETSIIDVEDHMEMILEVQHHYFDWIEDISPGWEAYWLSPKGEGLFKAKIGFSREELEVREKWGAIGNMVIVYGTPHMVDDDDVIYINTSIAFFAGRDYTTHRLTYGRSEQPY